MSMNEVNFPEIAYHAATPYPPVRAAAKNPRYAAAMLDNMAGHDSEASAVGLYTYAHLLAGDCREIADTFRHVAIVEMHHLEIFAGLAMALGENPRLWSPAPHGGRYQYWSPAFLSYPHIQPPAPGCRIPAAGLRVLLSQAIESEEAAVRKYMGQTSWIQDVGICDNLRRIAADEQMHADIFARLYHGI